MRLAIGAVFDQLVAEGLTTPGVKDRARAALRDQIDATSPWYVRVATGIGAWVATGFFLGFLFAIGIEPDKSSALSLGALLVAGAVYLRRQAKGDFARQLAFAMSLAGQVLVIFRIAHTSESVFVAGLAGLVLSVALIALFPDAAHRFMSGLIGSISFIAAVVDLKVVWNLGSLGPLGGAMVRGSDLAVLALVLFTAYVWRVGLRRRPNELAEMLEPAGYGVIVALFGVLLFSAFFGFAHGAISPRGMAAWHVGAPTTVGLTAALVALELTIFSEEGVPASSEAAVVGVVATVLLGALTLSTPGVMAAVAVLILGFDRRRPLLVGLAVVFLAKFASVYYYSLTLTLLEKSMVLVTSGLLLLAARAYATTRFTPPEVDA